jgi:hypothetical protein
MNNKDHSNINKKDPKSDLNSISNSENLKGRSSSFNENNIHNNMHSFFNEDAGLSNQRKQRLTESLGTSLLKKFSSSQSGGHLEDWKNFPIV